MSRDKTMWRGQKVAGKREIGGIESSSMQLALEAANVLDRELWRVSKALGRKGLNVNRPIHGTDGKTVWTCAEKAEAFADALEAIYIQTSGVPRNFWTSLHAEAMEKITFSDHAQKLAKSFEKCVVKHKRVAIMVRLNKLQKILDTAK